MLRWIFGDDIFVSYARADGLRYAAGLSAALTDRELSCRTDLWDTVPDRQLPMKLRLAIRNCFMLVVIATPAAARSRAVAAEIEEFRKTGRNLVVVDFDGAAMGAIWHDLVAGLPFEAEPGPKALVSGEPSPSVVARVAQSFRFLRKSQRLRRAFWTTAAGILALVAAGLVVVGVIRAEVERQRQLGEALRLAGEVQSERARRAYAPLPQVVGALEAGRIFIAQDMDLEASAILSDGIELVPALEWRRQDPVRYGAAAVDPARRRLFTSEGGGRVVLRDLATGEELASLDHGSEVRALVLAPRGDRVATTTDDGRAHLWDVTAEPAPVAKFPCPDPSYSSLALSPGGSYLAMQCAESLLIRDLRSGEEFPPSDQFLSVSRLAFSADERRLFVTESEDGYVRLWVRDVRSGEPVSQETLGSALGQTSRRYALSPDGRYLTTSCWDPEVPPSDCTVRVHETGSFELVSQLPHSGPTVEVFSPDGELIATVAGTTIRVWSVAEGRLLSVLPEVGSATVRFSDDGEHLAALTEDLVVVAESRSGRLAAVIPVSDGRHAIRAFLTAHPRRLISVTTDRILAWRAEGVQRLTGFAHSGTLEDAQLAVDGSRAAAFYSYVNEGDGLVVTLWDLEDGTALFRSEPWIDDFAIAPKGRRMAISGYDGTVLWTVSGANRPARSEPLWDESASPDRDLRLRKVFHHPARGWLGLVERGDETTELWSLAARESLLKLPEATAELSQPTEQGGSLLFEEAEGRLGVADLKTLSRETIELPAEDRESTLVGAICPGAAATCVLAYQSKEATRIWRPASGEKLLEVPERLWQVRFDHDARFTLAVSSAGVRVWDLAGGSEVFRRPGVAGVPVGFTPEGSTLVVTQGDHLELFRWRPQDLLDEGCRRLSSILALDPEGAGGSPEGLAGACPTSAAPRS